MSHVTPYNTQDAHHRVPSSPSTGMPRLRTQLGSEFHDNVPFTAVETQAQEEGATCPRDPLYDQFPAFHHKVPLPSPRQEHLTFPNLEVLAEKIRWPCHLSLLGPGLPSQAEAKAEWAPRGLGCLFRNLCFVPRINGHSEQTIGGFPGRGFSGNLL